MRKLKLIQRLATPIIMFATTQGVASTPMVKTPKTLIQSDSQMTTARYELDTLLKAKRLRELEQFSKSIR